MNSEIQIKPALRDTAVILTIKQVNNAHLLKDESGRTILKPTLNDNRQITKLHLLGTIVEKQSVGAITNILIDDGTDTALLRFFEHNPKLSSLTIGTVLRVIGRAREYNLEKYVFPEHIQKVNPLWLKWLHTKIGTKLSNITSNNTTASKDKAKQNITSQNHKESSEVKINQTSDNKQPEMTVETTQKKEENPKTTKEEVNEPTESISPAQKLLKLIQQEDKGNGIAIEVILAKTTIQDANKIIQRMIETGDLFQNAPGKIKVL